MSVGTAFYPRQQALNVKQAWGEWAGYFAPAVYADFHDIEYSAIREAAAVIDTSPLYKYVVRGTDAARLLDRVITRDVVEAPGRPGLLHALVRRGGQGARRRDDHADRRHGVPDHRRRPLLPVVPAERDRARRRGAGRVRVARGPGAAGQAQPRGARGRDTPGLGRRPSTSGTAAPRSAASTSASRAPATPATVGYELWIPADGALEVWDAIFEAGAPFGIFPAGHPGARRRAGRGRSDPDRGRVHELASRDQRPSSPTPRSRSGSAGSSTSARPADFNGRRGAARRARSGRSGPAPRRARARLGGRRGHVREARPRADDLALRRPLARPRLQGQRAGRPGDLDHLGHDDQEDGRLRLGGQGAREARDPRLRRVQRRG